MNSADLLRAFASPSLTQANRAFLLHWGSPQSSLGQALIAHRIDISDGLYASIVGHLTCRSTRASDCAAADVASAARSRKCPTRSGIRQQRSGHPK